MKLENTDQFEVDLEEVKEILARMDGVNTAGDPWWLAGQAWAIETGISDGTIALNNINREHMVTMLYRYAKIVGIDTETTDKLTDFEDADTVSSWAEEAMAWAVGMGLIEGRDGLLAPDGTAKRAEVATVYQRLIEAILS